MKTLLYVLGLLGLIGSFGSFVGGQGPALAAGAMIVAALGCGLGRLVELAEEAKERAIKEAKAAEGQDLFIRNLGTDLRDWLDRQKPN